MTIVNVALNAGAAYAAIVVPPRFSNTRRDFAIYDDNMYREELNK